MHSILQRFGAAIEDAHVAAVGEQSAALAAGDLMNDLEFLQIGERLHHCRVCHLQLLARGNDADNRLALEQIVNPQHGCGGSSERPDARPVFLEQGQQLPRGINRLVGRFDNARQEEFNPRFRPIRSEDWSFGTPLTLAIPLCNRKAQSLH
jgi:hypothetical protein